MTSATIRCIRAQITPLGHSQFICSLGVLKLLPNILARQFSLIRDFEETKAKRSLGQHEHFEDTGPQSTRRAETLLALVRAVG